METLVVLECTLFLTLSLGLMFSRFFTTGETKADYTRTSPFTRASISMYLVLHVPRREWDVSEKSGKELLQHNRSIASGTVDVSILFFHSLYTLYSPGPTCSAFLLYNTLLMVDTWALQQLQCTLQQWGESVSSVSELSGWCGRLSISWYLCLCFLRVL